MAGVRDLLSLVLGWKASGVEIMAKTCKLGRGDSYVDFLEAAGAGFQLRKWYPKIADIDPDTIPPYLVEDLDIRVSRGSDDDLAASLRALDEMRRWAAVYEKDEALQNPVWWFCQMLGESGQRRVYVRKITGEWRSDPLEPAGLAKAHQAALRLQITRHPYWEDHSRQSGYTVHQQAGASILYDYTQVDGPTGGDVAGNVPARSTFTIYASGMVDRVWAGIRSELHGDPASFENIWECENANATAGTDCSAPTTDADASPGSGDTKRVVDFATEAGWAKRWTIRLDDAADAAGYNLGRMLWLFRGKVDSGTECEVQLRFGYAGAEDTDFIEGPIVPVTHTSYDQHEMGQSQMPPLTMHGYGDSWVYWSYLDAAVQIWARRTSGSGSLHLDCLCPVPIDEGWLIAHNIQAISGRGMAFYYTEYDHPVCTRQKYSPPYSGHIPEFAAHNFRYPPGDGRLVVVPARVNDSSITLNHSLTSSWYPRWVNLRGSE